MIRGAHDLKGFCIGATDGEIGEVKDIYFDDERWVIRYLVVDTGEWLPGRKVLISPLSVRATQWGHRRVDVALTRQQVKHSPDIDTDKPVSRQHEAAYFSYYGYPAYWDGASLWGATAQPLVPPPISPELHGARTLTEKTKEEAASHADSHLRSTREVSGYHIQALDGTIGHIEDFLFDEHSWQVRYIEVDTRNWWPGKHVLIAPQWIDTMDWSNRTAHVHVTRAAIKDSPPYDPTVPLPGSYEADLHRHYGRPFRP
jgi:uncharacterized protein YrrD